MNRADLARSLASELGVSVRQSDVVVQALIRVMGRALVQNESVCLSNFGTIRPIRKSPRSFGPPASAQAVKPESVRVHFRAADRLLEAVKAGDDQVTFRKCPRELPRAS